MCLQGCKYCAKVLFKLGANMPQYVSVLRAGLYSIRTIWEYVYIPVPIPQVANMEIEKGRSPPPPSPEGPQDT